MTPHTLSFRDLVEATAADVVVDPELIFDMGILEENVLSDAWNVVWQFFKGLMSGGLDRASVIEQFREAKIDNPSALYNELQTQRDKIAAMEAGVSKEYPRGYEAGREMGEKIVGGAMWVGTLPLKLTKWILGDVWNNKFWQGGVLMYLAMAGLIALLPGGTTSLAGLALGKYGFTTAAMKGEIAAAVMSDTLPWLMTLAPYQIALLIGAVAAAADAVMFRLSRLVASAEDIRKHGEFELGTLRRPQLKDIRRVVKRGGSKFRRILPRRQEAWVWDEEMLAEAVMTEGLESMVHSIIQKVLIPFQGFMDGFRRDPGKLKELANFIKAQGIHNETTIDMLIRSRAEEYMQKMDQMGFVGKVMYKLATLLGDAVREISEVTIVPLIKILKKIPGLQWLEEDFHLHMFAVFLFVPGMSAMWVGGAYGLSISVGVALAMSMILAVVAMAAIMQIQHAGFRTVRSVWGAAV